MGLISRVSSRTYREKKDIKNMSFSNSNLESKSLSSLYLHQDFHVQLETRAKIGKMTDQIKAKKSSLEKLEKNENEKIEQIEYLESMLKFYNETDAEVGE